MKLDLNSLKFKIWLYIMLVCIFILGLLWILQIVFLQSTYASMKKKEIVNIGNEIVAQYDKENLSVEFYDSISTYAFKNNLRITLIDESGTTLIESDGFKTINAKDFTNIPLVEVDDIKRRFSDKKPSAINYTHGEKDRVQLSYIALLINKRGESNYLSIKSMLPPIDSTIAVLKKQLIMITCILLLLSILVSNIISKKLSVPIIKLTKSAEKLAKGDLDVEFDNSDYTELHQLSKTLSYATRELSKIDRYRKEFIANVSHDLKTPLTIIKCYSEMIRDVSFDNPVKRQAHCEIIIKETDRLTGLVSEILELSKLESSEAPMVWAKFDLSLCLINVLKSFNVLAEKEGYIFEKNISPNEIVYGDEESIKRAIYNLISNAVNYTGEDKLVSVSLIDLGKVVRFEVSDTGLGIEAEEINNIWDRYYKTTQTHKRAVIGTGIGLSIVKNVLTIHNTTYGVISNVGVGSTFWFEMKKEIENSPIK